MCDANVGLSLSTCPPTPNHSPIRFMHVSSWCMPERIFCRLAPTGRHSARPRPWCRRAVRHRASNNTCGRRSSQIHSGMHRSSRCWDGIGARLRAITKRASASVTLRVTCSLGILFEGTHSSSSYCGCGARLRAHTKICTGTAWHM